MYWQNVTCKVSLETVGCYPFVILMHWQRKWTFSKHYVTKESPNCLMWFMKLQKHCLINFGCLRSFIGLGAAKNDTPLMYGTSKWSPLKLGRASYLGRWNFFFGWMWICLSNLLYEKLNKWFWFYNSVLLAAFFLCYLLNNVTISPAFWSTSSSNVCDIFISGQNSVVSVGARSTLEGVSDLFARILR